MDTDKLLANLRRQRDEAAQRGDHDEALFLNDRIKDLKDGTTSAVVERAVLAFESKLARLRAYGPPSKH